MSHEAIIALGSNIDAEKNIQAALTLLRDELTIVGEAPIYETTPVGPPGQPQFLNTAVRVQSHLSGENWRRILRDMEHRLGRRRTSYKYEPRVIDLDLIWLDGDIIDSEVSSRPFLQRLLKDLKAAPRNRAVRHFT